MAKKIQVQVIKNTRKAVLVQDPEGRKAWVQNRSFKNNEVNEATFEKSTKFFKRMDTAKTNKKDWANGFHHVDIIKSTEKAIACRISMNLEVVDQTRYETVWIPKSLCKDIAETSVRVAGWFIFKKIDELKQKYYGKGADVEDFGSIDYHQVMENLAIA